MPNVENINKLIEWIKADEAKHFKMESWQSYLDRPHVDVEHFEYCNTAFCLAGWIDQHLQREAGATDQTLKFNSGDYVKYRDRGAAFLDISEWEAQRLFLMSGDDQREQFDQLPQEERARIAIAVLENLKAGRGVTWDDFVPVEEESEYRDDDEYIFD